MTMPLDETVAALHGARTDEIVITTMGPAREWMTLGPTHPLDIVYVPSTMGQGTALGLGLALARPERTVVTCVGDGSLLMNMGSLVSITAQAPKNLVVLLFDNGVYEVTGAQLTPASPGRRGDGSRVDFAAIARGSGFAAAPVYDDIARWRAELPQVLRGRGPTFCVLSVAPVPGAVGPRSPGPAPARAAAFMRALAGDA